MTQSKGILYIGLSYLVLKYAYLENNKSFNVKILVKRNSAHFMENKIMSMKFYLVLEDGTLDEEQAFTPESTKVIIIVDDQFKRIFLWKGANSGIKKKFIGSRAAAELRKTYYGFAYRLSVIEEGDETQEFEFTIKRSRGEATVGVVEETTRGIPTNPSTMGLESGVDIRLKGDEPGKKIISDMRTVSVGPVMSGSGIIYVDMT